MAPPSSRRSGHSRRAQYGLFTGYVLATIGALFGALLLGISLWRPTSFNGFRTSASDVVAPVGEAGAAARTEGQGLFDSISGYLRAGSQNAKLKKEVELARIRLKEADAVGQENARLKTLLGLRDTQAPPVTITRLVGSSASSTRRFAYLGAGSNHGVRVGMPVRSPRGVVGRVLEVGQHSARVLLLSDSESVLPVRRAKDDVVAFAEGRGDGRLRIRLINLGVNPLKRGDVFVTSGAGGYYQPGVAVAILDQVTSDGGIARVIADPAATDFVAVEPIWQPKAVESAKTPVSEALASDQSTGAAAQ
ncbi:rod shape-determining protein MreC [Tsuneonella flava]|uniref:Cell shape-determining protein MreC n=1 Tax=Tsuneonella flava TaxID=2055955 RepID=A0ABX7K6Y5_9SPHN|nr:rod shape-determining protein MreC [Tsuneonella flava]QSB44001.1 rod shape-determining protein MreC [Tsuneonella flava]